MASLPITPVATDFATAELVRRADRPSLVTLFLDGVESSAVDLADPTYLEFEYMQQMVAVIDEVFPQGAPIRALHLGAAACALPRALAALRPNSRQLAVELDGKLAEYVRDWFDLPRAPELRIRREDARQALDTTAATWDVIVRDAFHREDVPPHLRTLESARRARGVLSDTGIYLLNAVASSGLGRLGEEAAALLDSFDHVIGITDPAIMRGRRWGNIVLVASPQPIPDGLERAVRRIPLPTRIVDEAEIRRHACGAKPLRDEDAGWVPTLGLG